MTPEDFARIEEELSLTLPQSYRDALQSAEFQGEAAGFMEFTADADEVIGLNLEARQEGFFGVKWPEHYLIVGEDGAGNSYFTDLKRERPAVFLADHELTMNKRRLVTSEGYATFADFITFILKLQSETDAAFTEDASPEIKRKPWWKLW